MEWERVVGSNVRRLRKARGLSQERLSLEADIDLRYLGGIERGEFNPTVSVLGKLAAVLETHPAVFFGANDPSEESEAPSEIEGASG
jgi:transcriptional regulator with XRE-family HTH domain